MNLRQNVLVNSSEFDNNPDEEDSEEELERDADDEESQDS
jgi:hypothetical protein